MPELLLELFSEEIPARMQERAAQDLEKAVNQHLLEAGYMPESVKAFATPRRLVVTATGLPAAQPDRREEKKGPRVGAPEKAIEGFLNAAGLSSLDECETRPDKKGDYYVAVIDEKGRATQEVIAEFAPEIVRTFNWPKSMRWGDGDLRWVRPLKSILCAFDGEVTPFNVDHLEASDKTYGHRFMAPDEIQARNFDDYSGALRSAHVVLDANERAHQIAGEARILCEAQGLELVDDPALLKEVAGLAEWPVVMIGTFDEKFLSLPDEVLTASMRGHQKYFSVRDPKTGALANKFIFVANIEASDGGKAMREGYERVLTARLSDGWFLYQEDLKTPLADRIADLDRITFFEGLGTVGDKARRVAALAKEIAPAVGADPEAAARAAVLAKADLVTGMVYEFPELQGLMGRYYALAQDEPAEIADAVRDHYKPIGQGDGPATAPVSVAVALADKIDTLTAFWSIDKKPTGSKDPFALRRAALGVIETILAQNLRLGLASPEGPTYPGDTHISNEMRVGDLLSFFHDRLKVYLRDKGHRHDHIDAVLTDANGELQDDLVLIAAKLSALEAFLKTDDGANLAAGYKRAANILKAEEKKGPLPGANTLDPIRFAESKEKVLFGSLEDAEAQMETALIGENFAAAMTALSSLRAPIDAFFEDVTVNADDEALRLNRLALLQRFIASVVRVADFSKIEG
ncbi:MAG: glycine--tRNA ligase subunit beta [Pseudomonadota bacterium]